MKTKNNISAQIINTMKNSYDPWGIKDISTCFICENKASAMLQNIPIDFNVEGRFDSELPWAGATFEEQFQRHDRTVMHLEKSVYLLSFKLPLCWPLTHPGHRVISAPGDSLPCRRDASRNLLGI
ncbi:hypothetical protein [Photorhabdus heterorhabditis]|uniref:hypothetical protein n=1 Tax=Photorhabdus heterorhabditis TaxID=880156 RepID=UPI001561E8CC|nr:hypothetical protein [Photorhabdus heterorhabditis]